MSTVNKSIIIDRSVGLFFKHGIQAITMDDIAENCGISKKTIYKYFENKEDLLRQVIKYKTDELEIYLATLKDEGNDALHELVLFFNKFNAISSSIYPTFGLDLKKFYSSAFIELLKFKHATIIPFIQDNVEKGIKEGLYKQDIESFDLCESFDNVSSLLLINEFFFNPGTNKEAICFLNSLFIYRLVSENGLKVLKKNSTEKQLNCQR